MTKTMLAYETIKNTNFNSDYDAIELQLMPIVDAKVSDEELVDAIKGLFEDLQYKRNMTKERLEFFIYDLNDINYILFDGQNKRLKEFEIDLGMIVDSMK